LIVYGFDRRELRTPLGVAAVLIAYVVWRGNWLGLVGLPLIYLGWVGCSPNLNLIDGCLPMLAMAITFVLGAALASTGLEAAAFASGVTWLAASLESAWRCQPKVIDRTDEQPASGVDPEGK
jgi:hypothetical protein